MALANWRGAKERRDPIADKHLAKVPSPSTFEETAKTVIALRRPTWSSEKHAAQWESSLATYVFPIIGRAPVDAVTTTRRAGRPGADLECQA